MARIRARLFGHTGWIQAVTFRNDDGSILASVDDDTVRIWNIATNDCLQRLSVRISFIGVFFHKNFFFRFSMIYRVLFNFYRIIVDF